MQYPLDINRRDCYRNHMKPDDFARRLRELREERGLGSRELSLRIDRSPGFVSLIESRQRYKTKLPPLEALQAIARELEISLDELTGGPEDKVPPKPVGLQQVPIAELLRRIGARPSPGEPLDDLAVSASTKRGSRSRIPQGYDEARGRKKRQLADPVQEVEVEGRCMEDKLYPGDVVIFDIRLTPNIGDIVVAVRFVEEMLVKYLRLHGEHQYLEAKNGEVIPLDQYIRILGPVTWIKQRMR